MKKSILIVDDDKTSLRLAELILSKTDYEVHSVKSGLDAIGFLKGQKVDLILLDIEMPVMNGLKALEKIRQDKDTANIPVIFLTASADTESVIDACRLEAVDYIRKPFIPVDLLQRVDKAL